ncbi:hypothetical protein QR680_014155 [Steinernema hermaphroditum]|uniref:F-box domain-containing protein n=1 Tax=Steinernema hermaphroditum TaxID=289476 RepID=A0AA39IA65_9BILA|nr:hypothetical protein QR680_014155 [Steinernema hermaphroditum]
MCADLLPDELWIEILSWIAYQEDVSNCSTVCRQWHTILQRIHFQRRFSIRANQDTDDDVRFVLSRPNLIHSLEQITIRGGCLEAPLVDFLGKTKALKTMLFPDGLHGTAVYKFIAENFDKAQSLERLIYSDYPYACESQIDTSQMKTYSLQICEALKEHPRKLLIQVEFNVHHFSSLFDKVVKLPSETEHLPLVYISIQRINGQMWIFSLVRDKNYLVFLHVSKPEDHRYFVKYFIERYVNGEVKKRSHFWSPDHRIAASSYEYDDEKLIFTISVERSGRTSFMGLNYSKLESSVNKRLFQEFGQPIFVRISDPYTFSRKDKKIANEFIIKSLTREMKRNERVDETYRWCIYAEEELKKYGSHDCRRMMCDVRLFGACGCCGG